MKLFHEKDGVVGFARSQHELAKQQAEAINCDDLVKARVIGNQIKRLMPAFVRLIRVCKQGEIEAGMADEVLGIAREIRQIQISSTEKLTVSKLKLGKLIKEIRNGRRLINRYSTGRTARPIFEMSC